jgi:hypothetical protein
MDATADLGGQPHSMAVTDDGRTAAIAIENQRDEEDPSPSSPAPLATEER